MSATHSYKEQKHTLDDKYKALLAKNATSKDSLLSNPMNLFDDSNQKDKLWLGIARYHLRKKST